MLLLLGFGTVEHVHSAANVLAVRSLSDESDIEGFIGYSDTVRDRPFIRRGRLDGAVRSASGRIRAKSCIPFVAVVAVVGTTQLL